MKVSVETLEHSTVKLTVVVEAEVFNKGLDAAFEEEVKEVEIKGFRKGHVPRATFEKMFGEARLYDKAINQVVSATYAEAVHEAAVIVVAPPKIDVDFETMGKDKEFTYFATVAVKPEVTLGQVEGIEVKPLSTRVIKKDVEEEINNLLKNKSELVLKESDTLENGDVAIFDFAGFKDGEAFEGGTAENYQLTIGSGQFIPGFEEQMVGLKVGEEKDVNVTFPENYPAEHLQNAPVVFKVKLHEIKEYKNPELTEELIKEYSKTEATTLEAFEEEIKETLKTRKESARKNNIIDTVVKAAADSATLDIPHDMVHVEIDRMMEEAEAQAKQYNLDLDTFLSFQNTTRDQYQASLHGQAEVNLKYQLVLEKIAEEKALEASEDKLNETYEQLAAQYQMEVDQIKEVLPAANLQDQMKTQLAVDYLVDNANLK